jgi:hypothetical protein
MPVPNLSQETLKIIRSAWQSYEATVNGTPLKPNTKETYLRYAEMFVRWLEGDFVPGADLFRRRR